MNDNPHIHITYSGCVQVITIDNPKKKNALSLQSYATIRNALQEASQNDQVRITLLRGKGEYFSSGNDLNSFLSSMQDPKTAVKENGQILRNFVRAFIDYNKVLIAYVNGPAFGIAVTVLALCDIVYCSDRATFTTPFSKLAITVEGCSSYTFPRIMGPSLATEILLFNRQLSADEAVRCGFVSSILSESELAEKLKTFSQQPKNSLLLNKELMRRWDCDALRQVNDIEVKLLMEKVQSDEFIENAANVLLAKSKL